MSRIRRAKTISGGGEVGIYFHAKDWKQRSCFASELKENRYLRRKKKRENK